MRRSRMLIFAGASVAGIAVVAAGLSAFALHQATHSGVLWEHKLSAGNQSATHVAVLEGDIYEFDRPTDDNGARDFTRTMVTKVDAANGHVLQRWTHPSLSLPFITGDNEILFSTEQRAPDSDGATAELTLYSPTDERVWKAEIPHGPDESVYVTAAADSSVHVAVCGGSDSVEPPETSALTKATEVSTCALVTIDAAGTVSPPDDFAYPWQAMPGDDVWMDHPGTVLPRVTLVPRDLSRIDVISPSSAEALATLPFSADDHVSDVLVTPERVVTIAHESESGWCEIRSHGTAEAGPFSWVSAIACDPTDVASLAATTDPSGPIHLAISNDDLTIAAIDASSGTLHVVPPRSFDHHRIPLTHDKQRRLTEVAAGGWIVQATDAGECEVTNATEPRERFDIAVPGSLTLPASAHGITMALHSDITKDRDELPGMLRFNPLALMSDFTSVSIVNAATGKLAARAFISVPLTSMIALNDNRALVTTEDGRVLVIGAR
ncbi:hypothetical protein [Microbacterium sp. MPKO10]|uniref:hypothetical protein n=1 Tax=Microbacterium sp. MPKO10 TaxID=2989818 RepID=UPI0022355678|nr:hypothetical protein [Microbacterium sp. MPKO10]MCW4456757.1 hypothetical protein [Microbacterium sp. MPKO10]